MSWLDSLFQGINQIRKSGVGQTSRQALNFASGFTVADNPAAGSTDVSAASASVGLSSARPAASGSGRLYACTDIPVAYIDDPTAGSWQQVHLPPLTAPLAASNYATVGNITLNQYADTIAATLFANGNSVGNVALTPGSLGSSAAWVVELAATVSAPYNTTYPVIGVCVANGITSGTSNAWGISYWSSSGAWGLQQEQIGVGNLARITDNNQVASMSQFLWGGDGLIRLRLLADGTNLHYQVSNDGYWWWDWYTAATPSSLTYYGFYLGNDSNSSAGFSRSLVFKNQSRPLTQISVTGATNANPIVITTNGAHGLLDGDSVAIHGVGGNTNANTSTGSGWTAGSAFVHVTGANTFQLVGISGNAGYTSGGTVTLVSR